MPTELIESVPIPHRLRRTVPTYAGRLSDRFVKPPASELFYTVLWDRLQFVRANDKVIETIVSSDWVASPGISLSDPVNLGTTTKVKVQGGILDQTYLVRNEIVTSRGERHQWTFEIEIADYDPIGTFWLDPDAELTYRLEYDARYLKNSDVLTAALVTVPVGMTEISQDYDEGSVWVKVTGGVVPATYRVRSRVDLDTGEVDEHLFDITMHEA